MELTEQMVSASRAWGTSARPAAGDAKELSELLIDGVANYLALDAEPFLRAPDFGRCVPTTKTRCDVRAASLPLEGSARLLDELGEHACSGEPTVGGQ